MNTVKQPLGILPRWLFLEQRNEELILAMARHIKQQRKKENSLCRECVPPKWFNELVNNYEELTGQPLVKRTIEKIHVHHTARNYGETVSMQKMFFDGLCKELEELKRKNPGKKYGLDFTLPSESFRGITLNIIEISQ